MNQISLHRFRNSPTASRLVDPIFRTLLLVAVLLNWCGCSRDSSDSKEIPLLTGDAAAGDPAQDKPPAEKKKNDRVDRQMLHVKELLLQHRLTATEQQCKALLEEKPNNVTLLRTLSMILVSEGRRYEAVPYLLRLVETGSFSVQDLLLLGIPEEPYEEVAMVRQALSDHPNDLVPALGLIAMLRRTNENERALEWLRKVVAQHGEQLEAHAQLGQLLWDLKRVSELTAWNQNLPSTFMKHPGIWMVKGLWAEQLNQFPAAARCYWEAARLDPSSRPVHMRLARCLVQIGRRDEAEPFKVRAALLGDFRHTLFPMYQAGTNVESCQRAAQLAESLGRLPEAKAWLRVASLQGSARKSLTADVERLTKLIDRNHPQQTLATSQPALQVDLSQYPAPEFSQPPEPRPDVADGNVAKLAFADVARESGIDFQYFNSWKAAGRELMLLETVGGGVAVLDYDRDGWPDLYFAQCAPWPLDPDQHEQLDRLYRNLGNGTFEDVTHQAGLAENGYSQGAAVGDFDNDGFPDIYVGNVGQNRLFRNNGDGTFSLVNHHQDRQLTWTSSVMIADLNADGLPDIFDVNYIAGEEVFTKHCLINGKLRSCGPSIFAGEPDRLFLNRGDGSWTDVSRDSGLNRLPGRGLGIVALRLADQQQVSLFIANDGMRNYLLVNQMQQPADVPHWIDQAGLSGVATDGLGGNQASMGIAADDINRDGLTDFFVTNFYDEPNTLYVQGPDLLFDDASRACQLYDPSFKLLAFGTQFLDADLDGFVDLVLANGHIDDFRFRGEPWHMRPQLFRNLMGRQFVEHRADRLGPFFDSQRLGRGLALIDWNRDGREDFAWSDMALPAALVTNRSENSGHWLAIQLRGTRCSRDAIATRVTLEFDRSAPYQRALIGGSGFEASNQRQLIFGLGDQTSVRSMTIDWPDGSRQTFDQPPTNCQLMAIQGWDQIHVLPGPSLDD